MRDKKLYKVYDKEDNFVRLATFGELIKENYFVEKQIVINFKKRSPSGFNLKESDSYGLAYEIIDINGYSYNVSPMVYFNTKLKDITSNKNKIGQKIKDSLEFAKLVEFNAVVRNSQKDLLEVLADNFINQNLIVNFRK